MKQNPKEQVNIIELGQEFIKKLNEQCVTNKVNKLYEVSIKDGKLASDNRVSKGDEKKNQNKRFKTLKFTVVDLDSRERITLFSTDFVYSNPAEVFKGEYKTILYKEFFYGAVVVFAFNMEATIKQRNLEQVLTKPLVKEEKYTAKDFAPKCD